MSERARDLLLKIYKKLSDCRIVIYIICGILCSGYFIKFYLRTRSFEILKFSAFIAIISVVIAIMPYCRIKIFRIEYIIELVYLFVIAAVMILLLVVGFVTENEIAGVISCVALFSETVFAHKISQHENDF